MKTNLIFACFFLAACQSAPPVVRPLPDPLPLRTPPEGLAGSTVRNDGPAVAATRETPPAADAEKLTRQRQWIEALMAQNDALAARLEALKHDAASTAPQPAAPKSPAPTETPKPEAAPPVSPTVPATSAVVTPPPPEPPSAPTPFLMPNADGVIDTTVLSAPGNPPNPFAVRTLSADAVREVTFVVDGIFQGDSPCALVNGRVAGVGDLVESLRLTRIAPAALILTGDGFAINLPLGATKVRLAL